uniref:Uncharacterized protein n=1 Tax=Octopus bimaculoides TaxID=37653 RepID=A0A0L8G8Z2_OCTBM
MYTCASPTVKQSFKVNMHAKWNKQLINGDKELIKAGNFKHPDLKTVCQWLKYRVNL